MRVWVVYDFTISLFILSWMRREKRSFERDYHSRDDHVRLCSDESCMKDLRGISCVQGVQLQRVLAC